MNADTCLSICVNGEAIRVSSGLSIVDMLKQLGIEPAKVAVERNLEIVPRSTFGQVEVADGDTFEIVHFVGGG